MPAEGDFLKSLKTTSAHDPTFKGLWQPMTNFPESHIVSKTYESVISYSPSDHNARRPDERPI